MSQEEFFSHFRSLNVCMLYNWHEIRLRGKFLRLEDTDNNYHSLVLSKWHYKFEIKQPTHLVIGIHQEDERASGIYPKYASDNSLRHETI